MSYIKPEAVLESMVRAGAHKSGLSAKDVLIRGFLSGALLGFATSLALTAAVQTGVGIAGALVFPVGFVIIVLLGLELVTGNFALLPLAVLEKKATIGRLAFNWIFAFIGNLMGALFYAILFYAVVTKMGNAGDAPVIQKIAAAAEAKTIGYAKLGSDGLMTAFVSALLCNWMVTLGVVLPFASASTTGKVVVMWLPILIFFAQGYEHSVVNMFLIPAGVLLGARVSVSDWWLWNQIPVTLGNVVGGTVFTGLFLYATHRKRAKEKAPAAEESWTGGKAGVGE
ncbi:MAG: formate/nitrite transporter family protein [Nitrospinae bacterium]|nr:formate/nitrite transporter family protein [Nitrospinota bacterium]